MKKFLLFIVMFTFLPLQTACDDTEKNTTPTPCDGVVCSGRGICVVSGGGLPVCACFEGYTAQGLACLSTSDPCLGVTCSGHGSCVEAEDDSVSCDCDDGFSAQGLECVGETGVPVFQSTPTTDATAGVEYTYEVVCALEDAALELGVNAADTCGGTLVDNGDGTGNYSFTPPAGAGNDSCVLSISCTAGDDSSTQEETLSIHDVAAEDWLRITGGRLFNCGIRNGNLYCWGANQLGQLGLGHLNAVREPTRVGTDSDWTWVDAGWDHTCGIRSGRLYCWGVNTYGQLGDGTLDNKASPVQVGMSSDWTRVSAGGSHSCGIRNEAVYCWGYNNSGQIGDGSTLDRSTPTPVATLTVVSDIEAGGAHSCAISNQNLFCWGRGVEGQIGQAADSTTPIRVGSETGWTRISMGDLHSCGILQGALFCWGFNENSQLGNGSTTNATSPTRIDQSTEWTDVSLGYSHTCGIRAGGMYCWGLNDQNQLGDGTSMLQATPTPVGSDSDWQSVALSIFGSCGLRPEGLSCWGLDFKGVHGEVTTANRWSYHHCIIDENQDLFCWGNNQYGQLGAGNTDQYEILVPVPGFAGVTVDVETGGFVTCAVTDAGGLSCWGSNYAGQLGNGTTTSSSSPLPVAGLSGMVQVSVGEMHTCAVRDDHALFCWGRNTNGQLGDGTMNDKLSPVQVATDVLQVSCGGQHTCAIKTDKSIWCWGNNNNGQLGNGTDISRTTAAQVIGFTSTIAVMVSAGDFHTCSLMSDGSTYCWGRNVEGQLGLNSGTYTFNTARPTYGQGTTNVMIAAGEDETVLVKSNGSVLYTGDDITGYWVALTRWTSDFVFADSGMDRYLGIKSNGDVHCLGFNCTYYACVPYEVYYDGPIGQFTNFPSPTVIQ